MMEERYHVTTQNLFYPDTSNVLINKKYYSGGKTYQPTYVAVTFPGYPRVVDPW